MLKVGFHASHEQNPPSTLLDAVRRAEQAGFTDAMCSDHLAPWSEAQGHSGFAWSWLGAALQATTLPMGVVNAPGQRYHPAVIAQAAATLAELFPDRFWLAVGSGENSNEHVTGQAWPRKELRQQRLLECVEVMRALWRGEEVSHDGLVTVDRARVWSLPPSPPPLIGAAVSIDTARWVGSWADGLVTVGQPLDSLRRVVEAFREGGGEGKPAYVQVHLSYGNSYDEALAVAFEQWRVNALEPPVTWDLATPEHFETAAKTVRPEDVAAAVLVSADPAEHLDRLREIAAVGFDGVYLHHVGRRQDEFIDVFGEKVVPELLRGS